MDELQLDDFLNADTLNAQDDDDGGITFSIEDENAETTIPSYSWKY